MRVEIVAVGTELLLGQIADTNAAWLGEQLAPIGAASHFHQAVGDNHERIVLALRTALARSDAVIVCGGLGPTQDDITREAIAHVMNAPLERDVEMVERIEAFFVGRGRTMPSSNARQADLPIGATFIEQTKGTAPGLMCPIGNKVLYALPGVPYEMMDMFHRAVAPDLVDRMQQDGESSVIRSRVLRTWGTSESGLAEVLAERVDALDGASEPTKATIAFLASGMEGIKVRITVRAKSDDEADLVLRREEMHVRDVLERKLGDIVFGVDDESMEMAVASIMEKKGLTLAVAESLTGGLIASRLVNVVGASHWFKGGVVAYDSEVKFDLLGVPRGPVVSPEAALSMAKGVASKLHATVGLGITGVAGPDPQEDNEPGTVFVGVVAPNLADGHTVSFRVPGDRDRIRQYAAISAMDVVRKVVLS